MQGITGLKRYSSVEYVVLNFVNERNRSAFEQTYSGRYSYFLTRLFCILGVFEICIRVNKDIYIRNIG